MLDGRQLIGGAMLISGAPEVSGEGSRAGNCVSPSASSISVNLSPPGRKSKKSSPVTTIRPPLSRKRRRDAVSSDDGGREGLARIKTWLLASFANSEGDLSQR
jgi:hypothetical protein